MSKRCGIPIGAPCMCDPMGQFSKAEECIVGAVSIRAVDKEQARKHGHYFRSVAGLKEVDIYRLLELFGVTDQAIGHAIKKLLLPGLRGVKPPEKDVQEAVDTLNRWLEMRTEDKAREG